MNKNKRIKKILTKKFLIGEYVKNRKSMVKIAKESHSCFRTVRKCLRKYNIKIRTLSEAKKKSFKILTREFLQREHHKNKKSIHQIAQTIHCSHRVIYNHLNKYGIKIRMLGKKSWDKVSKILTKSFLKKEYIKNKKSTIQIAKETKCFRTTVIKYLKKFDIKRRTCKEFCKSGKEAINYIDGRTHNSKCIDCGKKISYNSAIYGNSRCHSCANKAQHRIGTLNSKGKNNPNYKHGKTNNNKCIDCERRIVPIATRCWECSFKLRFGKNNPNYIDGNGYAPYPLEFNDKLKEKIRKRDNYQCQNCNITESEHIIVFGKVLCVHHIDYDKKNCKETNLLALCRNCNIRANYNRDYWKQHYNELMSAKVLGNLAKGKINPTKV